MRTSPIRTPAVVGLVLAIPFALLELVFRVFVRPDPRSVLDPQALLGLVMLFGFLWALPFIFVSIGKPLADGITARKRSVANPVTMARVALLLLIAYLWGATVIDQFPCFLAVPNCD